MFHEKIAAWIFWIATGLLAGSICGQWIGGCWNPAPAMVGVP
jgi:hypothetical protein